MRPEEIRRIIETTLQHLTALTPPHRDVLERNDVLRWAIERLWITVGTAAEIYRRAIGQPRGSEPWRELYKFRNVLAHALPGDVIQSRVLRESHEALPRLVTALTRPGG